MSGRAARRQAATDSDLGATRIRAGIRAGVSRVRARAARVIVCFDGAPSWSRGWRRRGHQYYIILYYIILYYIVQYIYMACRLGLEVGVDADANIILYYITL